MAELKDAFALWPHGTPGAAGRGPEHEPTLTPYLAGTDDEPRPAVVVCPGGGYTKKAAHEGAPVAEWLNGLGVSAFVLQYRVSPYRHPYPLMDAQRAIRTVRSRAGDWRVDPGRIGILGFSAGGHLAATASTHWDSGNESADDPVERCNCRPDFSILCYAVISFREEIGHSGSLRNLLGDDPDPGLVSDLSNESRVDERTPPAFLWHTADDGAVHVANSLAYAQGLAEHGVPFSLHVFESGRHGLGLAQDHPEARAWTGLCADWLRLRRFVS